MDAAYYRQQAQQHQQEIAKIQKSKSQEFEKIADLQKRMQSAEQSASRASSTSTRDTYLRQAQGHRDDSTKAHKKISDLEGKISNEQIKANDATKKAEQEEKRASDKSKQEQEKHAQEQAKRSKEQKQEMERQAKQAKEQQQEQERRFRTQQQEQDRLAREREQQVREHEQRMQTVTSKLGTHDTLHQQALAAIEKLSKLPERITVLFIASNPLDQAVLRLDEEARAIEEMLRKSNYRDAVEFKSRWAARRSDILQWLNEHTPTIVHFSGHGSRQDELLLQDNRGVTAPVPKIAIAQAMATASGEIKLVFFNTCHSRNQAEAVVEHVFAAIGMNASIGDEAACVFAAQFYSAIGFGLSVKKAFGQAKAALMLEGILEENTPALFVASGVDADELILVKPPRK
jgi:myosin heavy subunit